MLKAGEVCDVFQAPGCRRVVAAPQHVNCERHSPVLNKTMEVGDVRLGSYRGGDQSAVARQRNESSPATSNDAQKCGDFPEALTHNHVRGQATAISTTEKTAPPRTFKDFVDEPSR
jgi:hypothetical protein